jgi:hypothetical protein
MGSSSGEARTERTISGSDTSQVQSQKRRGERRTIQLKSSRMGAPKSS